MNSQRILTGDEFSGNSYCREFLLQMNSQGTLTGDEFTIFPA
jgi:hypothetical protein